jgi:membrane protease YdiL (CAAX protease family)
MTRTCKRNERKPTDVTGTATTLVTWVETSVVLLLFAVPTLARVACWSVWGSNYLDYDKRIGDIESLDPLGFSIDLLNSFFLHLRFVPILLFVMWRSGDGWSRFGLVKPRWARDIIIGVGLSIIIAVADYIVRAAWTGTHISLWSRMFPAAGAIDRVLLCFVSACAFGFSEELFGRAYLIPRFETLLGATWKSILLCSVIFGLLHLHKGFGGVLHSILSAGIWGIGFCMTRRIWPVAISHALTDFVVQTHLISIVSSISTLTGNTSS